MASSDLIKHLLNDLADRGAVASVYKASFGWGVLKRYQPLVNSIKMDMGDSYLDKWIKNKWCNVFEIGTNCGDVFSVNMVDKIEIISSGALILLKR